MNFNKKCIFILLLILIFLIGLDNIDFNDEKSNISNDFYTPLTSEIPPFYEWNFTWGGHADDVGRSITIDSSNNVYVAGSTQSFGARKVDVVLMKFNKNNELLWNITWGGNESEWVEDIVLDSSNNIYITGNIPSSNPYDIFLAKFNSYGEYQWNVTWGGDKYEYGNAIVIDSSNNLYIAGRTNSFSSGDWDIFILKYDNTGTQIWNFTWGGSSSDNVNDLTIDSKGNIYGAGRVDQRNLLIKCNSSGNIIWTYISSSSYIQSFTGVTVDSYDNVYVCGYDKPFFSSDYDMVLFKFSNTSTGSYEWAKGWGGSKDEAAIEVATDTLNNIYVIGNPNAYSPNWNDIFLLKYNNLGDNIWDLTWGGSDKNEYCHSLALDYYNNIYVVGTTDLTDDDCFLVKFGLIRTIEIDNPTQNKIYGLDAPTYNLSILNYFGEVDIWYCLNYGANYSISSKSGIINQTAWDSCGNGTVIIQFFINDTAGNLAYDEITIRKDINLPVISINNPTSNQIFGLRSPEFNISIYDVDLHTSWYTLNGTGMYPFTGTTGIINQSRWDLLGNGLVTINFFANNSAGNIAYNEVVIQKSIEMIINSPVSNQFIGYKAPIFNFTLVDWDLYTVNYSLNKIYNFSISETSGDINQSAWDQCQDGEISIEFFAEYFDLLLYNNVVVKKDTLLPNITIIEPSPYEVFGNSTLNLIFKLDINEPNIDKSWYSINNGANYTFQGNSVQIDQLAWDSCGEGIINITFYANDTLGNVGSVDIAIIKDYYQMLPRNAYAIVIGIEDYPGTDSDLEYCRDDAEAMVISLTTTYNFNPENIILLLDSAATDNAIDSAFSAINNKITSEDIFLFYFSGHGGDHIDFGEYICPYDSINPFNPSKTYWDYVIEYRLDNLDCAQKYVIIDACNSGGIIGENQKSNNYIMTSCMESELCYETSSLAHGIFTYFFLQSDNLASDSNGDGVISMEEQYPYVFSNIYSYSGHASRPQEYDGISGQSVLYPSAGSLSFSNELHQLSYSFFIYGHGLIKTVRLSVCSVLNNLTLVTKDLKKTAPTYSGFGYYSGAIDLGSGYNITGYELLIEIEGFENFTFYQGFGDTDGDGLFDTIELLNGINPLLTDTDSDGLSDYEEYYGNTNPLSNDTDSDGIPDGYEVFNGLNPQIDDTAMDLDNDGLTNLFEYQFGSNVNNPDTDGDGMEDGWEYNNNLDLLTDDSDLDPDGDGLENIEEYQNNTNPNEEDTDGDGWNNGDEVDRGTDPLDPDDYPRSATQAISGYYLVPLFYAIFIVIITISKRLSYKK